MIHVMNLNGTIYKIDAATPEEAVVAAYNKYGNQDGKLALVEKGEWLIECKGYRARPTNIHIPIDALAPRRLVGGVLTEWCYCLDVLDREAGRGIVSDTCRDGTFHNATYDPVNDVWVADGPGYRMKEGVRYELALS